jgi:acetolactate synthase I/II/III large subunit
VTAAPRQGNEVVCATLEALGVTTVFGVPGTQNVGLFEALRKSRIRTVLATHELGAAFMANGYARASGRVGVLVTIPGPGFAFALGGLAEAQADSAALLHITDRPAPSPRRRFHLQHIDQATVAGPLVKVVFDVDRADRIAAELVGAFDLALAGEPGPVLLQIAGEALAGTTEESVGPQTRRAHPAPPEPASLEELARRLAVARRPLIFAGQGTFGAAAELRELVERCAIPVLTTPSGRGVIAEDHPLALCFVSQRGDVAAANALLEAADLVLAVGCKLTHNGTVGFALRLPSDRLVHVNSDREALGTGYPAALAIATSSEAVLRHLLDAPALARRAASTWDEAAVEQWRRRLQVTGPRDLPEPALRGVEDGTPAAFFAALRRALPRDAILVTDSGLHQVLARRHFDVLAPRGLIVPCDFQSMAFGVPAAIGAKLAAPERQVVAVVGDGGFRMSGMELTTALRDQVPVTVIVFNDGQLNQIRLQQLSEFGHAQSVELGALDLELMAAALGLDYCRPEGRIEAALRAAATSGRSTLVEVEVGDSPAVRRMRAGSLARGTARGLLPAVAVDWIKRALGRRAD